MRARCVIVAEGTSSCAGTGGIGIGVGGDDDDAEDDGGGSGGGGGDAAAAAAPLLSGGMLAEEWAAFLFAGRRADADGEFGL